MKEKLKYALRPSVVKRALGYAVVVGPILIIINHADALLYGQVSTTMLAKMGLTFMVPYIVSTLSSVQTLQRSHAQNKKQEE